jgi:hypothetical protein
LREWLDNTLRPWFDTHPARERSDCGKMGHTRRAVPVAGTAHQRP